MACIGQKQFWVSYNKFTNINQNERWIIYVEGRIGEVGLVTCPKVGL